jgi:spermidine synthase
MGLTRRNNELWFFEDLYTDTTYGFKVKKVLVPETDTGFQKLMILETERFGRVLVLDGIVQLTEEDEGIYHEWIVHWPLFSLLKPAKNVLIIGGGDGGVAREVLRHSSVKSVTMVEIDKQVIDNCREFMPSVSEGIWDDKRFHLIVGDGATVIKSMKGKCDLVIIDSTDPIGPARSLFNTSFYQSVYDSLVEGGIAIHQTGSLILQPSECPAGWRQMERSFDDVRVIQFANISYIGGPFSLTAGSRGRKVFPASVQNSKRAYKESGLNCSWYSPNISSEVYPEFQRRLEQNKYGEEVIIDIDLPNKKMPSLSKVARWSKETCEAINMIAFGTPMVSNPENFGDGDTLVQYIETSAINYRQYGSTGSANCFTCAELPAYEAVKYSIDYFGAASGTCWHIPRGSFSDLREIRQESMIYRAELTNDRKKLKALDDVYRPKLVDCAAVFSPDFKLPVETGFSKAFELIIDVYDCNYSMIASSKAVAKWASSNFCHAAKLSPIGKSDAPDFGHAKKKTSGPSVTQLLKEGSNISHYSVNWLLIVINLVSRKPFSLKKALASTLKYFKGERAVCWLIPRGTENKNLRQVADQSLIFEVNRKDVE